MAVIGSGRNLASVKTIPNNDYNFKVGSQVFLAEGSKNIVPWDVNLPTEQGLDYRNPNRQQRNLTTTVGLSGDYSKKVNPAYYGDGGVGQATSTQNAYWDYDAASKTTFVISRTANYNTGDGVSGVFATVYKKYATGVTNKTYTVTSMSFTTGNSYQDFFQCIPLAPDSTYLYYMVLYGGPASSTRFLVMVRIVKATGVISKSAISANIYASTGYQTNFCPARVDLSAERIYFFAGASGFVISYDTSAWQAPTVAAYTGGTAKMIGDFNIPGISAWANTTDVMTVSNDNPDVAVYMTKTGTYPNVDGPYGAYQGNAFRVYSLTWVSDSVGYKAVLLTDEFYPHATPVFLQAQAGNYYTTFNGNQNSALAEASLYFIDPATGACESPQGGQQPWVDGTYTQRAPQISGNHYVAMIGATLYNKESLISGYVDGVMYVGSDAYKNGIRVPGVDVASLQMGARYGYFSTNISSYSFTIVEGDADFVYGHWSYGVPTSNSMGQSYITRFNKPKTRISKGPIGRVISLSPGAYGGVHLQCTALPSDGDTITLGSVTYTFKATPNNAVANQIDIRASTTDQLNGIKLTLNATLAGAGVYFSSATVANPLVEIGEVVTNNWDEAASAYYQSVEVKTLNKTAATIPTTESGSGLNFSSTTMQGGVNEEMTVQFYAGTELSAGSDPEFVYDGQYYDSISLEGLFDYSHAEIDWTEHNMYSVGIGSHTTNSWTSSYYDGPVVITNSVQTNTAAASYVGAQNDANARDLYAGRGKVLLNGRPESTNYRSVCNYKVGKLT